MNLSDHFTLDEFTTSRTAVINEIDNSPAPEHITPMMELCEGVLEPVRMHFGPVTINSGYRSHDLNQAIGGSDNSQHSKGEAADIIVPGFSVMEICEWIRDSGLVFDQLIYEGRWTHISYGPRVRRSVLTAHFKAGKRTTYTPGISGA